VGVGGPRVISHFGSFFDSDHSIGFALTVGRQ